MSVRKEDIIIMLMMFFSISFISFSLYSKCKEDIKKKEESLKLENSGEYYSKAIQEQQQIINNISRVAFEKTKTEEEFQYKVTQRQQEIINETINNFKIVIEQYKHDKHNLNFTKTVSFEKEKENEEIYFKNEFLKINSKYLIKKSEDKEEKIIFKINIYRHEVGNTCYALLKQMDEENLIYGTYKDVELNDVFTPIKYKYKKICDSSNENIAFNLN